MKRIWALCLTLACINPSFGMIKEGVPLQAKQIQFRNLAQEVELTQSQVTAIAQDGAGFLWFGTPAGLNRYDGYEVRKYLKSGDVGPIPDNYIRTLFTHSSGSIWIGTDGGLAVYEPLAQKFEQIILLPDRKTRIYSILE